MNVLMTVQMSGFETEIGEPVELSFQFSGHLGRINPTEGGTPKKRAAK